MTFETELDVVRALIAGRISSPATFANNTFVLVRLAQAGAYADADGEVRVRHDADWLSPHMCQRMIGLPIIADDRGPLSSEDFASRLRGTVIRAFAAGDELRAVARIFAPAATVADAELVGRVDHDVVQLDGDGGRVLIEAPAWLDHLRCDLTNEEQHG